MTLLKALRYWSYMDIREEFLGLVEMKRRTGRKRDEADIEALEGGDGE